mmetsp:Transcript_8964/g.17492  ORF Transcript_8964/g.17492 Transcript_8964/m.17492 type:complete len:201 (+) Transcript_8964:617-1219(+)
MISVVSDVFWLEGVRRSAHRCHSKLPRFNRAHASLRHASVPVTLQSPQLLDDRLPRLRRQHLLGDPQQSAQRNRSLQGFGSGVEGCRRIALVVGLLADVATSVAVVGVSVGTASSSKAVVAVASFAVVSSVGVHHHHLRRRGTLSHQAHAQTHQRVLPNRSVVRVVPSTPHHERKRLTTIILFATTAFATAFATSAFATA